MNRYVFTFGHGQLQDYNVNPMNVALIIEAESESEARYIVWQSPIGTKFCTSYPYEIYIKQFDRWLPYMLNYTLDQLLSTSNKQ